MAVNSDGGGLHKKKQLIKNAPKPAEAWSEAPATNYHQDSLQPHQSIRTAPAALMKKAEAAFLLPLFKNLF